LVPQILDAVGLKCPWVTLKITSMAVKLKPGDVLEVTSNCSTFEKNMKNWCVRSKKVLLWIRDEDGIKRCQIQF